MRKKNLLLLALMVLALILPKEVFAASGVDLSRVKLSTGSEPLTFQFGTVKIDGVVEQKIPFTQSEINKIVKDTLKEKGLTELEIIEANREVEKAIRAASFTQEDVMRIKDNLITSAGVVPEAGNAVKIIKMIDAYMKTTSWDDVGTASATLLEDSTKDWVKDTATGFINNAGELGENVNKGNEWYGNIMNILDFCNMMMDVHERTHQKWTDIANGANAKRLLYQFYEALQINIDKHKFNSDEAGWAIKFDQEMARRTFTFLGADTNLQTWYLSMDMKQLKTNKNGSAEGEYTGVFSLSAEHDMSGFKTKAYEALKHMPEIKSAVAEMEAAGFRVAFATTNPGTAVISRSIYGTCKATIHPSGEIDFSYETVDDDTSVEISGTTVTMEMIAPVSLISSGGIFTFELGATKEDLKLLKGAANFSLIAPDASISKKVSGSGSVSIGWDESVWKPWKDGDVTLKHQ